MTIEENLAVEVYAEVVVASKREALIYALVGPRPDQDPKGFHTWLQDHDLRIASVTAKALREALARGRAALAWEVLQDAAEEHANETCEECGEPAH